MKHPIKQLFVLLLAFCLILSLAACAEKAAPARADSPAEPAHRDDGKTSADGKGDAEAPDDGAKTEFYNADKAAPEAVPEAAPAAYDSAAGFVYRESPDGAAPTASGEGTVDTIERDQQISAEPLKLTAAEWKDNENWPFFVNLVNTELISFPSFGLDPRNRVEVRVQREDGTPLGNRAVVLTDGEGNTLWQARTDKHGVAYLFWMEGQTPDRVVCGNASAQVQTPEPPTDPQGKTQLRPSGTITLTVSAEAQTAPGLQIMFIVDTTGSMSDEIAYLQKDFAAIAERVGSEGVRYSVNFYRDEGDEYVTRTNGFSSDVAEIQAKINAEYADGGGDTPEAVAEILTACLQDQSEWDEDSVKLAFLIFDAPPHEGKEAALQAAVSAAAEKGIRLIPVVASNADRETELFGRALAILTGGTYVFLTDDSGIGDSHLEPIVGNYEVELLQDLIVRVIDEYRA